MVAPEVVLHPVQKTKTHAHETAPQGSCASQVGQRAVGKNAQCSAGTRYAASFNAGVSRHLGKVLDLILSAAGGKAPGEYGVTTEVLGAGGPWRSTCNLCSRVSVNTEHFLLLGKEDSWEPSQRHQDGLNDHAGKILGRWIRPKILQF